MYVSERQAKRKKRLFLNKLILIACAILLVGTMTAFLSHQPLFKIELSFSGETITEKEALAALVNKIIVKNFLVFWKRDNLLFFPRQKIKNALLTEFPRLEEVKIKSKKLNVVEIQVKEREGFVLWCRENDECFFVDESGFIFAPANIIAGNAYLRFYSDENFVIGDFFLPVEKLFEFLNFREKLAQLNFFINQIQLKEENYELIIAAGGKIIVNEFTSLQQAYKNLVIALENSPLREKMIKEREKLEYFDLRFADRVVYKFK